MANYNIVFKEKSDSSLITSFGGTVVKALEHLPKLLVAELSPDAYAQLMEHPSITSIKEDVEIPVATMLEGEEKDSYHWNYKAKANQFAWHLQAMRAYDYWERGITGKGVKVGVMDGGIGLHYQFPNLVGGVDVAVDDPALKNPFYDEDIAGGTHGTMCASVIAGKLMSGGLGVTGGIAPDVELYSIKYMGYATYKDSRRADAINWAIENKMDILSISLGLGGYANWDWELYQSAIDAGVIIVASAGNTNALISENGYPAWHDNVITVAGLNTNYTRYTYNYGPQVDFIAPCRSVETFTHSVNGVLSTTVAVSSNGTSFSCPSVAAVFALYKQAFPDKTNQELYDMVARSTRKIEGQTGWDMYRGWGLPQPSPEILSLPKIGKRKGFRFHGYGDYIDCGNASSLNIKDNITLIARVKQDYRNTGHIFAKASSTGGNIYYGMLLGNDGLYPEYRNGSQQKPKYSYTLADNQEHEVAFVYDFPNKKVTIYIDGKPAQATVAMTGTTMDLTTSADNLRIGSNVPNTSNSSIGSFAGVLYTAKVYNRSLTAQEILDTYNGTLITDGLSLYYDLTGLETTSIPDLSGNNNIGTVMGAIQETKLTNGKTRTKLAYKPFDVTGLTATPADHSVSLSWSASSQLGVKYEVWKVGDTKPLTTLTTTTYNVTGLEDVTSYTFKILVVDSFGNTSTGTTITTTTLADIGAPNPVTGLSANVYTDTTVSLFWTKSSSTDAVTNEVYYGTTNVFANATLLDADVKINGYYVTGLTPNTTYYFFVVAKDKSGNKSTSVSVSRLTASSETIIYQESFDQIADGTSINGLTTEVGGGVFGVATGYQSAVLPFIVVGGKLQYDTSNGDVPTWTSMPTLPMSTNKYAMEFDIDPVFPSSQIVIRMTNDYTNSVYVSCASSEPDFAGNLYWDITKITSGTFADVVGGVSLEAGVVDAYIPARIRVENYSDGLMNIIVNGKMMLSVKDTAHNTTFNKIGWSTRYHANTTTGITTIAKLDNLKVIALP